jgi:hypothetical protein
LAPAFAFVSGTSELVFVPLPCCGRIVELAVGASFTPPLADLEASEAVFLLVVFLFGSPEAPFDKSFSAPVNWASFEFALRSDVSGILAGSVVSIDSFIFVEPAFAGEPGLTGGFELLRASGSVFPD